MVFGVPGADLGSHGDCESVLENGKIARFVVLSFLAMSSARLMWDSGVALDAYGSRDRLEYEDEYLHGEVVREYNEWPRLRWRRQEWGDDDDDDDGHFWESVALAHKYLAGNVLAGMRMVGGLHLKVVVMYVVGLGVITAVNFGMLIMFGSEGGESVDGEDGNENENVELKDGGCRIVHIILQERGP